MSIMQSPIIIPSIEPLHKRAAKIPATSPSPSAGWIIPAAALAGAEVVAEAAAAVLLETTTLTVLSEALRTVVLEPIDAVVNPELTGTGMIGAAVVTGAGIPGEPDTKEAAAVSEVATAGMLVTTAGMEVATGGMPVTTPRELVKLSMEVKALV